MLISEVMRAINEVEEKLPVSEWELAGIHFWPLLRVQLHFNLFRSTFTKVQGKDQPLKQTLNKPLHAVKGLIESTCASARDSQKNASLYEEKDVLLLSNGVSYLFLNDLWYDKFCGPFIEYFHKTDITSLLLCPSSRYLVPRYQPSCFIQPMLDGLKLKNKLFLSKQSIELASVSEFNQLAKFFEQRQLPIKPPSLPEIATQVNLLRRFADFFRQMLQTVKPALALSVFYYGLEGMAFNLACWEQGIPSVDIQHGLQGEFHVAYGRWKNVPAQGYELLPTFFWCWSESEALAIQQWSQVVTPYHQPLIGGDLLVQLWQEGSNPFFNQYKAKVAEIYQIVSSNSINILYTLNGLETSEKLIPMLELIKTFDMPSFWWIRLHPCRLEQRSMLEKLLQDYELRNCELKLATEIPLFILLEEMQLHLTELSSTVIEAARFGVPSVITHPSGAELFPTEIASGWAVTGYTQDEILMQMKAQLTRKMDLPRKEGLQLSQNKALQTLTSIIKQSKA